MNNHIVKAQLLTWSLFTFFPWIHLHIHTTLTLRKMDFLTGGKNIKKKTKKKTVIVYQMHCNAIYSYRNHWVVI